HKLPRALHLLSALALFLVSFLSLRSLRPTAAPSLSDAQSFSPNPAAAASEVYHSPAVFSAGYAEMERSFRVFVYPDGDPGTFYQTPRKLTGKYASEGYFFQNIRESRFRTDDLEKAHLFFVPISPHKMRGKDTGGWGLTIFSLHAMMLVLEHSKGFPLSLRTLSEWYVHRAIMLAISRTRMSLFHKYCSHLLFLQEEMTLRTGQYLVFGLAIAIPK
ncbi:Os06g0638300, partial [Oryza sativa Japonica Group]